MLMLSLSLAMLFAPVEAYTQQPVLSPFQPNEVVVVVGDSLTYESLSGYGWMDNWRYLNSVYHPSLNIQILNAGYAYLSNTVLNYPGSDPISHQTGNAPWQSLVVNSHPTTVLIWIGIDNFLAGYGVTTTGTFDMTAYGQDLQNIIDAARRISGVRQVALVTPMCAGEKRYGQNPQDSQMANMVSVINQTSINNAIPVIDLWSMMRDYDSQYNTGGVLWGVGTGDGIHPYTPTSGPNPGFENRYMEYLIGLCFYRAAGE